MLRKTNKEMTMRCQDLAHSRAEGKAVIRKGHKDL